LKVEFTASFQRDLKRISDSTFLQRVNVVVLDVQSAESIQAIRHVKKMGGAKGHYRIRVGEYRIGVRIMGDMVTFVRVLDRKDLYKYFP